MANMIYVVGFHTKNPKKVHHFWFTDRNMAVRFWHSLETDPKVINAFFYAIDADQTDEYDRGIRDGLLREIARWDRSQQMQRKPKAENSPSPEVH